MAANPYQTLGVDPKYNQREKKMNSSSLSDKAIGKRNKIIWAVDPAQNPNNANGIIQELKTWSKNLNCDIQPVSIFSKSSFNLPSEMDFPWEKKFSDFAHQSVNHYLKNIRIKSLLPAELLFVQAMSVRKMAEEMAIYAKNQKALLIFANTQAKKTWNPFRLGGFAERLIATSKVPVLLLNPKSLPSSKSPSILFPTDFSQGSKFAFEKLGSWAKAFKSKIILYNQIEDPFVYTGNYKGAWESPVLAVIANMKIIEAGRIKKAKEWSSLLQNENITCTALVLRQQKTLSEEIFQVAKKQKAGLIALASFSDPVDQFMLGSIARNILLRATCPVLVFHQQHIDSKQVAESKKELTFKTKTYPEKRLT